MKTTLLLSQCGIMLASTQLLKLSGATCISKMIPQAWLSHLHLRRREFSNKLTEFQNSRMWSSPLVYVNSLQSINQKSSLFGTCRNLSTSLPTLYTSAKSTVVRQSSASIEYRKYIVALWHVLLEWRVPTKVFSLLSPWTISQSTCTLWTLRKVPR